MLHFHIARQPSGFFCCGFHHLQVLCLRSTHHVPHLLCTNTFHPVNNAREVGGGVVITTITFANNERQWFIIAICEPIEVHHIGAITLFERTRHAQTLYNLWQQIVVCTFTHEVGVFKQHPKSAVHAVEVLRAFAHQYIPHAQGFRVAGLQRNNSQARTLFKYIVGFKLLTCNFVERVEIANRKCFCCLVFT